MANPRAPTREELASFLPNTRCVRSFEQLFDLIPEDLTDTSLLAEIAFSSIGSLRNENQRLQQRIDLLEIELESLKKRLSLEYRFSQLEVKLESLLCSRVNLDPLVKRIEVLEALRG